MDNTQICLFDDMTTDEHHELLLADGGSVPNVVSAADEDAEVGSQASSSHDLYDTRKPSLSDFPKSISFILGNELFERFCYYGIRAILIVFLVDQLKFTNASATAVYHSFVMLSYFTPVMGAILADGLWGKYLTIVRLSLVYCVGCVVLAASAITPRTLNESNLTLNIAGMFAGLFLISVGTGGIKPSVAAFGADQFGDGDSGQGAVNDLDCDGTQSQEVNQPRGRNRRRCSDAELLSAFFALFYFSINTGSLVSTIVTPIFEHDISCFGNDTCYSLAFGVPAVLMISALILFVWGKATYIIKRPSPKDNVIGTVVRIIYTAVRRRFGNMLKRTAVVLRTFFHKEKASKKNSYVLASTDDEIELDSYGGEHEHSRPNIEEPELVPFPNSDVGNIRKHWLDYAHPAFSRHRIEEVKRLSKVLVLFVPLPVFWMVFDQQGSRWTLQAMQMNGDHIFSFLLDKELSHLSLFGFDTNIPMKWLGRIDFQAEQMQVFNSIFVVSLIPVSQRFAYPFLTKYGILTTPLQRMGTGLFLSGVAFAVSAFLQWRIYECCKTQSKSLNTEEYVDKCSSLSILWQLPQYFIMTVGEILFSITSLDFAYSQAPSSMKSVCQAANLLTTSFGNLLVVLITEAGILELVFASSSPDSHSTQHLMAFELLFYASMVFAVTVLFLLLARRYRYVQD